MGALRGRGRRTKRELPRVIIAPLRKPYGTSGAGTSTFFDYGSGFGSQKFENIFDVSVLKTITVIVLNTFYNNFGFFFF